jgi:AcrR family transcriptional regulator
VSTSAKAYHHGDLRAALVASAVEMLEAGEAYSMRAVARRAGVSPTAPYRHFADRSALDSAVAVEGFKDLRGALGRALGEVPDDASPVDVIAELGVAYVDFALRRPAVFRLMFGGECDTADSDRVQASQALHAVLGDVLTRIFPGQASPALATALWGLAHGLAFLHLDGKYRPEPVDEVADRVRAAAAAILAVQQP